MSANARFVGWVEYAPTHFHAEFEVVGHAILPDHSQVNLDTLIRFGITIPDFPDLYKWRRERFQRRLKLLMTLRGITGQTSL